MRNVKLYNATYYLKHKTQLRKDTRRYQIEHPEMGILANARRRCNNPKREHYRWYGARGIKCLIKNTKELIDAIGRRPSKEYSLDRIDNNGHYEIGNIRWATVREQETTKRHGNQYGVNYWRNK